MLAATNELLERDGFGQLTIAAIAERAGTTKTAIYRRWPTKAHLVHEAAFPDLERTPEAPSVGSELGDELRMLLATGVEVLSRPATRAAIPGLLVAIGSDVELHDELRQRFVGGSFQRLFELVDAAIIAGEIRPDAEASVLLDLISGAAFLASATRRPDEIGNEWIDSVVSLLLRGLTP